MDYETAIHEAGHLVAARHFGYKGAVIEGPQEGMTHLGRLNLGEPLTRGGYFPIFLGGLEAQRRVTNNLGLAWGRSDSDLKVLEGLPGPQKRACWRETKDVIDQYWEDILRIADGLV